MDHRAGFLAVGALTIWTWGCGPCGFGPLPETAARQAERAARIAQTFRTIQRGMNYDHVVWLCGRPDYSTGTTPNNCIYEMPDGSTVVVTIDREKGVLEVQQHFHGGKTEQLVPRATS